MKTKIRDAFRVLNAKTWVAGINNRHGNTTTYYRDRVARRLRSLDRSKRRELLERAAGKRWRLDC
ncbi:MAG TPA: hypothetical protein VNL14_16545 [Candidatus Acidoferrales bacterium]|nr:hypothetical protein [Candidatus Acidoferrales bacterium]